MLAKLSTLLSSKVALAAIGGALVIGGGATAAAAATGHLPDNVTIPGISHNQQNGDQQGDQGKHAHTIGIEGVLTGASGLTSSSTSTSSSQKGTITVKGTADDQGEASDSNNDGSDKSNGTPTAGGNTTASQHDGTTSGEDSRTPTATTPTPHAGNTTGQGESSLKCDFSNGGSITVDNNTRINGQASTLADLAKDVGHNVQVQATGTDCKTLTAWKVTVGGMSGGQDQGQGDHANTKSVEGTVGKVDAANHNFTVQPDHGNAVTVNVSSSTKFSGTAHDLSGLKTGMRAQVLGTLQSNGSIDASSVASEAADGSSHD